jgi:hypothetical protein
VFDWDVDAADFDDAPGHPTPEEAARGDIPPEYARAGRVNYSDDGRRAVVELLTNEEPTLYPYYVMCVRDSGGLWHDVGGHN